MKIGILGASRIAPKAIIEPAKDLDEIEVEAVAARDVKRAKEFADKYNIATVYNDYETLIKDPNLDAIYIGLPPSLHYQWSIAALESQLHVLVEKPFSSNAIEAKKMVAVSEHSGYKLIEAFHWRFHPLSSTLIELCTQIGTIKKADTYFNALINNKSDIRYQLDLSGGATMDIGCYPIHWLRTLLQQQPKVLEASCEQYSPGIDAAMEAKFEFPSGISATMQCAMTPQPSSPLGSYIHIEADQGYIKVDNPIAPHNGHRLQAKLADGTEFDGSIEGKTTYWHQLKAFFDIVQNNQSPITGGLDAIENMQVIDEIYIASGLGIRGM